MSIRKAHDEVSNQQSKIQGAGTASRGEKGEDRCSVSKIEVQSKSITKSREASGHSQDRPADNIMREGNAARAEQNLGDAVQPSQDRAWQADPEL